jgi:flagellar L-ring protein precursor FlgH
MRWRIYFLVSVGMLLGATGSASGSPLTKLTNALKNKPDPVNASLQEYLESVRVVNAAVPATLGSLWVGASPLAVLSADYKARNPGDLVVIHLTDNFTAGTSGENQQSRAFTSNSAITGLVGTIGARNRLQNLFNANSGHSLDGKGQSTLASNVQLNFSAQVVETLPNGILVVQGARDIDVGNDRQTVILRGLVRPGDLAPDNSILSSAISNLQVEIKGKGAVADTTRQPNIVIRTLLRLFSF